jgi:hypothetical protein
MNAVTNATSSQSAMVVACLNCDTSHAWRHAVSSTRLLVASSSAEHLSHVDMDSPELDRSLRSGGRLGSSFRSGL